MGVQGESNPITIDTITRNETAIGIEARERFLLGLYKKGLDTTYSLGEHGTSLETLQRSIQTGTIPGASIESSKRTSRTHVDIDKGDLFFYPYDEELLREMGGTPSRSLRANHWVKKIAQTHRFLDVLGLDLSSGSDETSMDTRFRSHFGEYGYLGGIKTTCEYIYGITDEQVIDDAVDKALRRKGVFIEPSPEVPLIYKMRRGNEMDDVMINVGTGLPIEFLSGLKPLGSEEKDFFEALETKYG